jgi:hypothetical protein
MAQGAYTLFEALSETISGTIDLENSTFKMALINNTTVPAAGTATPQLADFTQVAGGNGYTTGGETLTTTWGQTGGTGTFDATGDPCCSWTKNGSGPTDIYYGILYDSTVAGDHCVGFIDMTTDGGTTPISLQAGDISITPHASGFFTLS